MSFEQLLNSKVNIIRITETTDSVGSRTESKTVLHLNLPCRINWVRGSARVMFNKTSYYRDAKIYCRCVSFTVHDQVLFNGIYYEIVNISNVDSLNKYLIVEIKLMERQ